MKRFPKPENLVKLTPKQKEIFDGWQKEAEASEVIIQQILNALAAGDQEKVQLLTKKLDDLIPHMCEHGHSIHLNCADCEEIERTLFPENYNADGTLMDDTFPFPKTKKDFSLN